jgi:hypothetical protein
MTTYNRWATADEVEAHLNGYLSDGIIEGAVWVLVSGEISEGTAQFDLTVPLWEEDF